MVTFAATDSWGWVFAGHGLTKRNVFLPHAPRDFTDVPGTSGKGIRSIKGARRRLASIHLRTWEDRECNHSN